MKFSTTSGLVAALAGTALADWPAASSSSSSSKADPVKSSSTCAASTTTVTETETSYKDTTTVYRSTVYVGPGPATTVYPSTCPVVGPTGGAPGWGPGSASSAPGSTPAGPVGGNPSGSSGSGSGWGGKGASPSSVADPATTASAPAGSWSLNPGKGASVIATNEHVYSWTGSVDADPTTTGNAPKYTGWGDWSGPNNGGSGSNGTGPAPGSDASNVTKPFPPLTGGASCNSASDRSKWCGGLSVDTDTTSVESSYSTGHICSYDLTITNTTLNFDGIDRLALAVNGQVPGPLIECNWGDILRVKVTNQMQNNATTIHWHGITQKGTNDQDGVPGVSECAIAPGASRTYSFKLTQFGTGWYHSHVLAQYGDGIRGPMVVHGPATANYDVDGGTIMVDDVFGTANASVSCATQNSRIAHFGPAGTWNYLLNGANTSPDLTKGKHALWTVQPGKKYLFRFINSAAQNMFVMHIDNHKFKVIATDYVPIEPYTTEFLNIGIGQRYDVIVEMNQPTAGYFLRAFVQTGCPSGSANPGFGKANGIIQYAGADATLPTSTFGNKTTADFAICLDEPLASLVPHVKKSAGSSSAFAASASTIPGGLVATAATSDDGVVFRWFLNNGAINVNYTQPTLQTLASGAAANSSLISNPIVLGSKDQWVYFVIQNQFFASHPMHTHGHDFSVLGQGTVPWTPALIPTLNFVNPARRDTAMLTGSKGPGFPPGYTVIGFQTDNPGAWLMHCHIIWHVDGGLSLQWIERPTDITATKYASSQSFQSECSGLKSYYAAGGADHTSGSSGLKRRSPYFDDLVNARSEDVVRRSDSSKHYIDSFVKRGLGDGYKPRHGARR